MVVTENELDVWIRGNSREAQGVTVEAIWRLVAASSPNPIDRRFPLGDSVGQHGPDGELEVEVAYEPFVPAGRSFWEIGTGINAGDKATSDYTDLTGATPRQFGTTPRSSLSRHSPATATGNTLGRRTQ